VQIANDKPPIRICMGQGPLPDEVSLIGPEDLRSWHRITRWIKNDSLDLDSRWDLMLDPCGRAWFEFHVGPRAAVELNKPCTGCEIIEFHPSIRIQCESGVRSRLAFTQDVTENSNGRRSVGRKDRMDL